MASRVATLILLGVVCVGFASAQIAADCCLRTTRNRLPLPIIDGYIIQEAGKGCDISATTFITKVGKRLCVSHPNQEKWVKSHIEYLDKKRRQ